MSDKMKIVAALCAVAGAVALWGGIKALNLYTDRRVSNFSSTSEIYIYQGTSVKEAQAILIDSCKALRPRSIKRCMKEIETVVPGHYTVSQGMTGTYAARMLSRGWQSPVNLVLSGTLRHKEVIARKISRQMLMDSLEVITALRDSALLASYGFTPENVFALFIPDTYQIYWTEPVKKVLDRQKAAYDAFWTPRNRSKAEALGLSPMEVSIVASIVDSETNHEPEMPAIAGVYLNRLKKGMKLQADPTVAYCFDYGLNRILRIHTLVDSPYNTYRYAGLPPAPICVPSRASLDAVLNPDTHGYIFFCASPDFDGTHRFASTYTEHLRNARQFQRALDARAASR